MAAVNYSYPETVALDVAAPILLDQEALQRKSPFLEQFPDEETLARTVRWSQRDNITGLMVFRGLGGAPGRVNRIGSQEYEAQAGVLGEFIELEENELTDRAARQAMAGGPIDVSELVAEAQMQLMIRRLNVKEKIVTDFVVNGVYSVPGANGTTQMTDSFTPQTFTAANLWSDTVNSTPFADLLAIQLVPFGQSVDAGPDSEFVINRVKFNQLLANRNAADFWGMRLEYGATVNSLESINTLLSSRGCPKIRVYDGFYAAEDGSRKGVTTRFISTTNKGVLICKRTNGAKAGKFKMTFNLTSGSGAPYTLVKDRTREAVPGTIEVHHGFNGGPALLYPGVFVSCNV